MLQALIIIASTMMASGVASGQESETVIDTSVSWESDEVYQCGDDIRVADGGVLTIRGVVDLTCNITVDEGNLNLDNSILECGIWDEPGNPDGMDCGNGLMGYGYSGMRKVGPHSESLMME